MKKFSKEGAFKSSNKIRKKDETRFKYSFDQNDNWVQTPLEFNVNIKCTCQGHEQKVI